MNIEYNVISDLFQKGAFDIYTDIRDVKGGKENIESKNNVESEVNKIADEKEKKRKKLCQSNIVNNTLYFIIIYINFVGLSILPRSS